MMPARHHPCPSWVYPEIMIRYILLSLGYLDMKRPHDFIIYCIFGAMATAVNMLSYEVLYRMIGLTNVVSVALSWFLAVTFAFFTNKYLVFSVKGARNRHSFLAELGYFYACRALSGVLDIAIMFVAVDIMAWNHTLWKFIANLAVGICNYLAGRFFIFAKKKAQSMDNDAST